MQQLSHTEHYPVSLETFWKLTLDLEYQRELYVECLGCETMEVVQNDGDTQQGVQRNLRFRKPIDAPAPVRKMFGEAITLEEHGTYHTETDSWSFWMKPPFMADRLRIEGKMRVEPKDGGVDVTTETEFDCRIFGLGGIIERFAVTSARDSNNDKVRFTRRYIADKGLS